MEKKKKIEKEKEKGRRRRRTRKVKWLCFCSKATTEWRQMNEVNSNTLLFYSDPIQKEGKEGLNKNIINYYNYMIIFIYEYYCYK
jgi:hypothetical protein